MKRSLCSEILLFNKFININGNIDVYPPKATVFPIHCYSMYSVYWVSWRCAWFK